MAGGGAWQGGVHGRWAMAGRGACMQEKRTLKPAVHILVECILVYICYLSAY